MAISAAIRDHKSPGTSLRVLGVDPALAGATGYGVVDCQGSRVMLIKFGALKLPARASLAVRLHEIHALIARLLVEFAPDVVAVEAVFTALNVRTALKLAEVRGVVLLAAAQAQIPAQSYSPREVKATVAGYGAASKQQMQQMVSSLLGLTRCPEPADAADALAVALCHAQMSQARERMAAATGLRSAAVSRTGVVGTAAARGNRARPARIQSIP